MKLTLAQGATLATILAVALGSVVDSGMLSTHNTAILVVVLSVLKSLTFLGAQVTPASKP